MYFFYPKVYGICMQPLGCNNVNTLLLFIYLLLLFIYLLVNDIVCMNDNEYK